MNCRHLGEPAASGLAGRWVGVFLTGYPLKPYMV